MSAEKGGPPFCTQDDMQSTQIAQIFTTPTEQLFSPSDGLFEIEVAEVTSQGTEDACLTSEIQLEQHISRHHSLPPTLESEQGQNGTDKAVQVSFL
ncbi:hypothetical protein J7337_013153 [Fusarium musae]|uniref:Uncharacterized protein n=1 Tax=Fusarium musae TaxID=1042133 RepID=A0A9P8D417_9HYPO|nr:hypothetical protein J7337_013153 [Fusarium musae]KAG9494924.1 hypothetical protein J7337_013153 [Fusarium musae]